MIDFGRYTTGEELFDGHYRLLRTLSTAGGTADVWLAEDMNTIAESLSEEDPTEAPGGSTAIRVAIKIYRPQNALDIEGRQRFSDEYKVVYNCHHTNLLQPSHFSIFRECPYLVLPYCRSGSSERLIGRMENRGMLWKFISDVASGLAYLHANNPAIIHRDVKPANILIDDNGDYCITDFGISVRTGRQHESLLGGETGGTLAYMAPECFSEAYEPSAASDIWAFGATLYELITGEVPFGEEGGHAQGDGAELPPIEKPVDREIRKLVRACLDAQAARRPTAAAIAAMARKRLSGGGRKGRFLSAAAALLAAGLAFLLFLPAGNDRFAALCDTADAIVEREKAEVREGEAVVGENLKFLFSQAADIYAEALKTGTEDTLRLGSVRRRAESIAALLELCEAYRGVLDTIALTERLEMPEKREEYISKRDRMRNDINRTIKEL